MNVKADAVQDSFMSHIVRPMPAASGYQLASKREKM